MGGLSKLDWQAHEGAEALLRLERALTDDEVERVLADWNPQARHNAGAAGAYFTPPQLAHDLAALAHISEGGRYLDLCAGIGRLTWALSVSHRYASPREKARTAYTCVEINPEYCAVGRRLMPWADWVCGSAFDPALIASLGTFDVGIANPPFGRVRTRGDAKGWLRYRGSADLQACEVLARLCTQGALVIMPQSSLPWGRDGREQFSADYRAWSDRNRGWQLERTSLDPSCYAFEGTDVLYDIAELTRAEGAEATEWGPLFGARIAA